MRAQLNIEKKNIAACKSAEMKLFEVENFLKLEAIVGSFSGIVAEVTESA